MIGGAMVFAAGLGTRMRPLTDDLPKPMIRVAGRPLIDHALDIVKGCAPIVVNSHYKPESLHAHLTGHKVTLSHEPVLLDTGGGLRNALRHFAGPDVITLNSDAVWTGPSPLGDLVGAWRPDAMDALLVLIPPAAAPGYRGKGDFLVDDAGRLSRGPGFVYSGLQILHTPLLDEIEDEIFSLNRAWDLAQRRGRLFGIVHRGGWCDVGRPDSIGLAEAMLDV